MTSMMVTGCCMCTSEVKWGGTHALDDHKKADQFSFTCALWLSCGAAK